MMRLIEKMCFSNDVVWVVTLTTDSELFIYFLLKANYSSKNLIQTNATRLEDLTINLISLNQSHISGDSYRLYCSQDIYHCTIKTLPVD